MRLLRAIILILFVFGTTGLLSVLNALGLEQQVSSQTGSYNVPVRANSFLHKKLVRKKIDLLQRENKRLILQVRTLQGALQNVEIFAQKKIREIQDLRDQLGAMRNDYDEILQENQRMKESLQKLQSNYEHVLEQCESLFEQHESDSQVISDKDDVHNQEQDAHHEEKSSKLNVMLETHKAVPLKVDCNDAQSQVSDKQLKNNAQEYVWGIYASFKELFKMVWLIIKIMMVIITIWVISRLMKQIRKAINW